MSHIIYTTHTSTHSLLKNNKKTNVRMNKKENEEEEERTKKKGIFFMDLILIESESLLGAKPSLSFVPIYIQYFAVCHTRVVIFSMILIQ